MVLALIMLASRRSEANAITLGHAVGLHDDWVRIHGRLFADQ